MGGIDPGFHRGQPELDARKTIDAMLAGSGWVVQDYASRNLSVSLGVAVREYPLGKEKADYALFIGSQPVGVVEAKRRGYTLSGVEGQSERYLDGLYKKFPRAPAKPPFAYETTGNETMFTDKRDPRHRSRHVFSFHQPTTLRDWLSECKTLRAKLKEVPKLNYGNLWDCQSKAITGLEESLSENRPRALIQMATGSGKTFTAVTSIYRLVKFAGARRVLFLVDRANLGRQALRQFQSYQAPDDGRRFTELYNVQLLQSNSIDPACKVVISTVQRMFSVLTGDKKYDEKDDEFSSFEEGNDHVPADVRYNASVPIEEFDFIVIDECHRSIYNKWKQVLDYFDAFLIGLTATPSNDTVAFFHNNQVTRYTHERAVVDGVNVGYQVYRIKTKITDQGGKVIAGLFVEKRHRVTRERELKQLDNDLIYGKDSLDRSVVALDQIRLVIRTFKNKLPEIFPGRTTIPKTLIFAKDDMHAEDITVIVREEFGEGNHFCKKITYRSMEGPEELLSNFRNTSMPRIAVTVDMVATGTDIKPLECIVFMRDVKSKSYFAQMKGRGTRTIDSNDLVAVTPDARAKTHFVVVDAVGVCEHAMGDTRSLLKRPSVSLKNLMDKAVDRNARVEDIESLVYHLSRLNQRLSTEDKDEILKASGGKTLSDIGAILLDSVSPDIVKETARRRSSVMEPGPDELKAEERRMIDKACSVFDSPGLRRAILDLKSKNEQVIDDVSIDELLAAGYSEEVRDRDKKTVENWLDFLKKNRDKIVALDIIYSTPYRLREIAFSDIEHLASAIEKPPYGLTPNTLWGAYQRLNQSKVRGSRVKMLTDIISLVRYSIGAESTLVPFSDTIDTKFEKWLSLQESLGRKFTVEQREWLAMIKNAIVGGVSCNVETLDDVPFNQKGGRVKFYQIFNKDSEKVLDELHEVLLNQ